VKVGRPEGGLEPEESFPRLVIFLRASYKEVRFFRIFVPPDSETLFLSPFPRKR